MSRGPGKLQRKILAALAEDVEDGLPRRELRRQLPDTDPANLRRAVRGLRKMGLVREEIEYYGERWLYLVRAPRPLSNEELAAVLRDLNASMSGPG